VLSQGAQSRTNGDAERTESADHGIPPKDADGVISAAVPKAIGDSRVPQRLDQGETKIEALPIKGDSQGRDGEPLGSDHLQHTTVDPADLASEIAIGHCLKGAELDPRASARGWKIAQQNQLLGWGTALFTGAAPTTSRKPAELKLHRWATSKIQ